MKYLITTHDIDIFKMFYTNIYHKQMLNNLYIYVDKYDSTEYRNITNNTNIFDKNDFIEYYGNNYYPYFKTFNKILFINMLYNKGMLNESFYFTDDDTLIYNNIFYEMENSNNIICVNEPFLNMYNTYKDWKNVYNWFSNDYDFKYKEVLASNFYIPINSIHIFCNQLNYKLYELFNILKNDCDIINDMNNKCKSRTGAKPIFFLDALILNIILQLFNNVERRCISFGIFSQLIKYKNNKRLINTVDVLDECVKITKSKKQYIIHFIINDKKYLMSIFYKYLNNIIIDDVFIDDVLKHNKRQYSKLIKTGII